MITEAEEIRGLEEAARSERKYKRVSRDPQFSEMMELLVVLTQKYGFSRLFQNIRRDYRNKWVGFKEHMG